MVPKYSPNNLSRLYFVFKLDISFGDPSWQKTVFVRPASVQSEMDGVGWNSLKTIELSHH